MKSASTFWSRLFVKFRTHGRCLYFKWVIGKFSISFLLYCKDRVVKSPYTPIRYTGVRKWSTVMTTGPYRSICAKRFTHFGKIGGFLSYRMNRTESSCGFVMKSKTKGMTASAMMSIKSKSIGMIAVTGCSGLGRLGSVNNKNSQWGALGRWRSWEMRNSL